MPFVKIYYSENTLNEEELEKMGECIHLSLIEHLKMIIFKCSYLTNKTNFYIIHIICWKEEKREQRI